MGDTDYSWHPFPAILPYADKMMSVTDDTIVFRGYFHVEPEAFPVERILIAMSDYFPPDSSGYRVPNRFDVYHIEILSKSVVEDTTKPKYYDEEFGGHACLFPCDMITLTYRVLETNPDTETYARISENILRQEADLIVRNLKYTNERQLRRLRSGQ